MSKARVEFNRTLDSDDVAMCIWAAGKSFVENLTLSLSTEDVESLMNHIFGKATASSVIGKPDRYNPFYLYGKGWDMQVQVMSGRILLIFSESTASDSKIRLSCYVSVEDFIASLEALRNHVGGADESD